MKVFVRHAMQIFGWRTNIACVFKEEGCFPFHKVVQWNLFEKRENIKRRIRKLFYQSPIHRFPAHNCSPLVIITTVTSILKIRFIHEPFLRCSYETPVCHQVKFPITFILSLKLHHVVLNRIFLKQFSLLLEIVDNLMVEDMRQSW